MGPATAARNETEECLGSTMVGRSRALIFTKRHKTSWFGDLAIIFLAIISDFRDKVVGLLFYLFIFFYFFINKVPLGVRFKSTRRRRPRAFCHKAPVVPR